MADRLPARRRTRRHVRTLLFAALAGAVAAPTLLTPTAQAAPIQLEDPAPATAPVDPPTPEIPQRYLEQEIEWSTCAFDAQVKDLVPEAPTTRCATVTVPMDWNEPDAHPDVELAISYSEATGESQGLLTTNPGGPGGAGLSFSASFATAKPELFEQWDLLGFDPRGFGQSEALRCETTAAEIEALPTTPDYRVRDEQTHATEVAEAELYAEACASTEFSQFVSSQQTVFDMDFLRALMGERQLSFVGVSYGTWLGGWYADTYPSRVGRFVLDSNMDWTRTQEQNVNFDPFSGQRRRDTQLFPWIARHSDQIRGLGSTPARVLDRYEGIRADLVELVVQEDSPVRAEGMDSAIYSTIYSNTRFTRATVDILVHDEYTRAPSEEGVTALHVRRAWNRLAPELQAYDDLDELYAYYGLAGPGPAGTGVVDGPGAHSLRTVMTDARVRADAVGPDETVNLGAIGTVVRCNDTAWNPDVQYHLDQADAYTAQYPFFGYMNGVPFCANWEFEPQDRQLDLTGSPRMLMVQAELDPATAWEGGRRTHDDLTTVTRFVSVDDEGKHGQYVSGPSACAGRIGDRFLATGELPGRDRVCGTIPLPEDGAVYPVDGPVDGNTVPLPEVSRTERPETVSPMLVEAMDEVAAQLG